MFLAIYFRVFGLFRILEARRPTMNRIGSKTRRIGLMMCIILFLQGMSGYAAELCIVEGGTGSRNGSSWSNALPSLPAALVRGNTYWIADGTYSGHTFEAPESGDTYIFVKKAIASNHGPTAGWVSSYGDGVAVFTGTLAFDTGYYDVDGQVGSGRSGHGFRVDITSGTNVKHIFSMDGPDSVKLRHIECKGVGEDRLNNSDDIVYIVCQASDRSQNWELSYMWLHDTNRTCVFTLCANNFIIQNCVIERRHTNGTVHGELFSINDSGMDANVVIRNNIIADCAGTGLVAIKDYDQAGFELYGNLFYQSGTRYNTSNGIICMTRAGGTTTNTKIYNNTFVNANGVDGNLNPAVYFTSYSTAGNEAYNNILFNTAGIAGLQRQDYNFTNDPDQLTGEAHRQLWTGGTGLFEDYATLDYRLAIATEAGVFLGAEYAMDMLEHTRGTDGRLDRGAYELEGSGGIRLSPAKNLRLGTP
jgi:hypothetical protein